MGLVGFFPSQPNFGGGGLSLVLGGEGVVNF